MKYQEGGGVEYGEYRRRQGLRSSAANEARRAEGNDIENRFRNRNKSRLNEPLDALPQDPFKLSPGRYTNPNGEEEIVNIKKGGAVKAPSASRRGDGCASRGKTKGRFV